jgi:hypothetical protein
MPCFRKFEKLDRRHNHSEELRTLNSILSTPNAPAIFIDAKTEGAIRHSPRDQNYLGCE